MTAEGYEVESAGDGEAGLAKAAAGKFHLVILDVMLPRKSGFDVCRELRQKGVDIAILMLTAKTQVVDRVVGLKLGADDYLTKPFDPAELLARVEALLRRIQKENRIPVRAFNSARSKSISSAPKCAQWPAHQPREQGNAAPSVPGGQPRARCAARRTPQKVWEYNSEVSSRTIDVHVAWLRQKLEENVQLPRHIQTIRGKGYRFVP